nr:MAG TPA: hypothetical protein [Microviridae sp.]
MIKLRVNYMMIISYLYKIYKVKNHYIAIRKA